MRDFGVVFTRCVREPAHDRLWRECHRRVRERFPQAPVVIIDDASKCAIDDVQDALTTVVASPFPGAGEMLPLHYLLTARPFAKALVIQDSMFLRGHLPVDDVHDVALLWDFPPETALEPIRLAIARLGARLERAADVRAALDRMDWRGAFGVTGVFTLAFLDELEREFGISRLPPFVRDRQDREALERVAGACCWLLRPGGVRTLLGDIRSYPLGWSLSYDKYLESEGGTGGSPAGERLPVVKVFNGR